jgi:hypothetical protein
MRSDTVTRQEEFGALARQISAQLSHSPTRGENVVRPAFAKQGALTPDQVSALNSIVRAADMMSARQERIQFTERRSQEAEEQNIALRRQLTDTEDLLRIRTEELQRERKRSAESEQRSATLLDKAQLMLAETQEQLAVAEKRANQAEEYLAALHDLIRENLEFS